jgi:hypothetical protein
MKAWESGQKPIITSVNILTEGFDMPVLDCLVFARPTLSSTLFLQAVGRVLRPHPFKDYGFLVDLTDNTSRFGTDLDNIKITVPKSVQDAEAKERSLYKICPNCEAEVHIALRECSVCGFAWPETECVVADALPDMKDVVFIKSPPKWFDVEDWEPSIHESQKTGKTLGKIDYFFKQTEYKLSRVSMFLCFPDQYSGYAVQMSENKWHMVSEDTFPESIDDFMTKALYVPLRVEVDINGKYPELISVEPDMDQFVYPVEESAEDLIPF